MIKQFLAELGLDYYYEIFKEKQVTTNMLLASSLDNLLDTFGEIDQEHIALISLKAQEHENKKKLFYDLRD